MIGREKEERRRGTEEGGGGCREASGGSRRRRLRGKGRGFSVSSRRKDDHSHTYYGSEDWEMMIRPFFRCGDSPFRPGGAGARVGWRGGSL